MRSANDPRDSIVPGDKDWEEFRAGLAAGMLLAWLLSELDQVAPGYFADIDTRFQDGFGDAEMLARDDPAYDGAVPIQWPNAGVTFLDRDFAEELADLLFPHGEAEGDVRFIAWGLAVVAIQSALESYARAGSMDLRGGTTRAIRAHLPHLDAHTADLLADCEATRHIFVHNRGIVDAVYIRRVPDCQRLEGDRRDVDLNTATSFARAARKAAALIRSTRGES